MERASLKSRNSAIAASYRAGQDFPEIAAEFDLSESTIRRALFVRRVPMRRRRYLTPPKVPPERRGPLFEMYLAGTSAVDVGRKFGVSGVTVLRYLRLRGITPRRSGGKFLLGSKVVDAIVKRYLAGENSVQIADTLLCSDQLVRNILRRNDVTLRHRGPAGQSPEAISEIRRRRARGEPVASIAADYGLSTARIYQLTQ